MEGQVRARGGDVFTPYPAETAKKTAFQKDSFQTKACRKQTEARPFVQICLRERESEGRCCNCTVEEVCKQYYRSAAWLLACRSTSSILFFCFLLFVLFTPLVKMSSASVSREIKATLSFLPQGHLWRDLRLAFREIAAHRGDFAEMSAATTSCCSLCFHWCRCIDTDSVG